MQTYALRRFYGAYGRVQMHALRRFFSHTAQRLYADVYGAGGLLAL